MAETTPGMIFVNELRYGKPAAAAWIMGNEYSRAVTPQIRQAGNRLSGLAETAYASLLA